MQGMTSLFKLDARKENTKTFAGYDDAMKSSILLQNMAHHSRQLTEAVNKEYYRKIDTPLDGLSESKESGIKQRVFCLDEMPQLLFKNLEKQLKNT